ncbi:hypothetical protein COCSADRAFT_171473 [Bipolaris sorokiniana ND90Pr]|uniref:Uncharacterized protein n=1 Tax=Cochliobolus sativus (strain ND90Pr / ATCC 201652) TaxID=665912 RepID=M2SQ30_COCSN|nr:uncharacterized protein COCSADRAFT_171473 [Bipolaris sorokiniana ND90Pr]EMD64410.1 hypothetical protein COCSADRAFT_171473 [Bipolaris sorokiniana ND90Pr]
MDARSIVACNNIATEERRDGYQLSQGSVLSEGSDSPFVQPGMTGQESANLIFDVGSVQAVWSHTQGGCMGDRCASNARHHASRSGLKHHLGTSKRVQNHSILSKSNISDPTSKLIKDTPAAYRHDPTHSSETHTFRNKAIPKLKLLPVHIRRLY